MEKIKSRNVRRLNTDGTTSRETYGQDGLRSSSMGGIFTPEHAEAQRSAIKREYAEAAINNAQENLDSVRQESHSKYEDGKTIAPGLKLSERGVFSTIHAEAQRSAIKREYAEASLRDAQSKYDAVREEIRAKYETNSDEVPSNPTTHEGAIEEKGLVIEELKGFADAFKVVKEKVSIEAADNLLSDFCANNGISREDEDKLRASLLEEGSDESTAEKSTTDEPEEGSDVNSEEGGEDSAEDHEPSSESHADKVKNEVAEPSVAEDSSATERRLNMTNTKDSTMSEEEFKNKGNDIINDALESSNKKMLSKEDFAAKYYDVAAEMLTKTSNSLTIAQLLRSLYTHYEIEFRANNTPQQDNVDNDASLDATAVENDLEQRGPTDLGDDDAAPISKWKNPFIYWGAKWQIVKNNPEKRKRIRNRALGGVAIFAVGVIGAYWARNNPQLAEVSDQFSDWHNSLFGGGEEATNTTEKADASTYTSMTPDATADADEAAAVSTEASTEPPEIIRPNESGGNVGGIEYPAEAYKIDNGEGLFKTFEDKGLVLNYTQKHDLLQAVGPELEKMGVAYRDTSPEIGGWGLNKLDSMPQKALDLITEAAKAKGYL